MYRMASGLNQWESDPLFSAAEVVQDSADRMESIFRFLLHELSLVQDDFPDPKLHTSIDYHKRELATTLEMAKWQLEDFERAVSFSAMTGKSQVDVISRHKQFVQAISEQIASVEKRLEGTAIGDPVRNTEWVKLNEEDRDGLALFLSGGNATEHSYDGEDSNMLRRFLDPTTSSSAKDSTAGIVEQKSREIENFNRNAVVHVDRNIDSRKENNLRKVSSYPNTRSGFEFTEPSCNRYGEGASWDLEAAEAKPESLLCENKLSGVWSRINAYRFLTNIWTLCGSRVTRNYTKRFKDGEEQSDSPSSAGVSDASQGRQGTWLANVSVQVRTMILHLHTWLGVIRARYQRSPYRIQVQMHAVQLVLIILLGLVIIGTLAARLV